jgi:shikimate dehydrogenase
MFRAAFDEVGLRDWAYIPIDVERAGIGRAFGVLGAVNVAGANVTIPHKEAALGLVSVATPRALAAGAVNLVYRDSGRLIGDNTDGGALIESLAVRGVQASGLKAVIFGAGGSARGCAAALVMAGAREIVVLNRTEQRAAILGSDLRAIPVTPGHEGPSVVVGRWDVQEWDSGLPEVREDMARRLASALSGAGLVVNTTTLTREGPGEAPGRPPIPQSVAENLMSSALAPGAVFCDLVYSPVVTVHLEQGRRLGLETITGLEILARQAFPAFELWTGLPAPKAAMARALVQAAGGESRGVPEIPYCG